MRAIALFVLQVIAFELTRCQGGGGGPSTFGYDASSACSKPYSRAKRAYYEDLPCDFRRQSWCTIAGSSYPWHAVRRFVRENQGLMRRMYGDESYFNVFRAEFEKNDIELKYDEYHQYFADDLRRFQYDNDYELIDDSRPKPSTSEYEGRAFTGRSFNDPITKRLKFPKLSEYTRSHFKPTERIVSSSTAASTTISSSTSLCSTSTPTSTTTSGTATPSSTTSASVTAITEEASTQPVTASTFPKPLNSTVEIANNDSTPSNTTTAANSTTTALPSVTVVSIVKEQNFSINEIPGQIDRIDENLDESAEVTSEGAVVETGNTTSVPTGTTNVPKELLTNREKEEDAEEEDAFDASKTAEQDEMVAESNQQEEFRPRPDYRPSSSAEADTGGQLYQDAAAQEQPVLKLRGVNACPVKEEVVAPFWANNTRGEVLALLNLYPFEQYVHWEKCTHENKQMHCRDGCRCEQQYRLHRLLAYDPSNECRGIFSDWFKFPSCCICRCYDLPIEFRVTSRSPRTSHKRRIKVQPPMRDRYA